MEKPKFLTDKSIISLIVPTYRQGKIIKGSLLKIQESMEQLHHPYEVIVVIDGFVDETMENVEKLHLKHFKVFGYPKNCGKGYAIRYGTARAKGDIIAFIDADMDIHPNSVSMLLAHLQWYNADIIVGSKLHPVSKVHYPFVRRVFSWGYRLLTKILFGLSIRDTQVGIKLFKRNVIEDLLPRLLVKRYAFDVEMLAVANYLGYKKIYEAPIELDFKGVAKVQSIHFWQIVFHMLWDTLAVFYRLKILHYYDTNNKKNWLRDPLLYPEE